jgi:hypothetical protein
MATELGMNKSRLPCIRERLVFMFGIYEGTNFPQSLFGPNKYMQEANSSSEEEKVKPTANRNKTTIY